MKGSAGNPRWDRYRIDLDKCGPLILDALINIKDGIDPTLTCPKGLSPAKAIAKEKKLIATRYL